MSRFTNRGERNENFFNQHSAPGRGGKGQAGGVTQSSQALNALLRACHSSGSLSLTNRDLSEIPLLVFSASLDEGEKFWETVPLQKLDLSFNTISALPEQMAVLAELQVLKLRGNLLSALPPLLFDACPLLKHLDVGGNSLRGPLEGGVGALEELQELHLPENQLTALPPLLGRCSMLQVLNMYQNQLSSFPDVTLPHLVSLNVGKNQLHNLPQRLLDSSPMLETLIVCRNKLTQLPDLTRCSRLKVLDAQENRIHTFPFLPTPATENSDPFGGGGGGFGDRGRGRHGGRPPSTSPPPVLRATRGMAHGGDMPEVLQRSRPRLPSAPPTGPTLSVVNLGSNNLAEIPPAQLQALLQQSSIAELHLNGNTLTSLNGLLFGLNALKLLDVSNNSLTDFPYEFGYLEALQIINLEGNPIRAIRRTLIARADSNLTQDLKKFLRSRGEAPGQGGPPSSSSSSSSAAAAAATPLDYRVRDIADGGVLVLSKQNFQGVVPQELFDKLFASHTLHSLTTCDLSSNQLESPPFQLHDVETLTTLVLSGNKLCVGLRDFSSGGSRWISPSLRVLDVSSNGLSTEHAELLLEQAQTLRSLDLSKNALQNFPQNIQCAGSLRELAMSFNQIRQVSSQDLSKLPQLESLDISNNKLTSAGFPLATLHGHRGCMFRIINFSNNDLIDVPYQYGYLENLQSLQLQGNGIKSLRQQVINGPIEQLKQALRNRAPAR